MYKRKIFQKIVKEIDSREMILIIWSRQVWKSTILNEIYNKHVNKKNSIFINADFDDFILNLETSKDLLSNLKLAWFDENSDEIFSVFIDEFQKIKNIWTILKWIYDKFPNVKFYLSWSSSVLINKVFWDSMLWRKKTFYLDKLDFEEFLIFKNENSVLGFYENIKNIWNIWLYQKDCQILFEEFIKYWWYPTVVLSKKQDSKIKILEEIYNSYLQKDIKDFFTLEHSNNIKKLFTFLTSINTNYLKINSISNALRISNYNLSRYLSVIEWTYIVNILKPFFTNNIKTVTKTSELFFSDTGFYNFILKNFNDLDNKADKWILVENAVHNEIFKNLDILDELFFYRDNNQLEVDLILKSNWKIIPIEIKSWIQKKIPANLKNFTSKNNLNCAVIFNKENFEMKEEKWVKYFFIPYFLSWKTLKLLKNF